MPTKYPKITAKHGVRVRVSVEFEVEAPVEFDYGVERAVTESYRVRKFKSAYF